jgi:hypothetical protein
MKTPLTFLLSLTFHFLNRRGNMRTIIFVFLFSLLSITPAHAMTGNEWLLKCGTKSESVANWSFEYGVCIGYLNGISETNNALNHTEMYLKIDDGYYSYYKFCKPNGVELGQLEKIVTKWLNEHPEKLHKQLSELYVVMMRKIFPCKSQ